MREFTIPFDWGTLRGLTNDISSSYPPIILWPGLGMTAEEFIPLLRSGNKHRYRVIAVDPPGHGKSSTMPTWSISNVARIFEMVSNWADCERCIIGGHSIGATASLAQMVSNSDKVAGLILIDGGYANPFPDKTIAQLTTNNAETLEAYTFDSWERFLDTERSGSKNWNDDIEQASRATAAMGSDGRVRLRIDLQTLNTATEFIQGFVVGPKVHSVLGLFLYGDRYTQMASEQSPEIEWFKHILPNIKFMRLPGNHDLLRDCPSDVIRCVDDFVLQFQ